MPTNPFTRNSRSDERQIADQTKALRAYEQARKRLISSMKGEERVVTALGAAQAAASARRARDAGVEHRELNRTSELLAAQGLALKSLDSTRKRYHADEMERSQSLLHRYEGLKQALREIQQDSGDTTTVLGSIVQPFKAGIDQMLRFGEIPRITQPIRDGAVSFDDITGSISRSAGAAADLGRAMTEVFPTVFKYRNAIDTLNVEITALKLKYADATEGTKQLADAFIEASKTDIIAPGAVETVVAVTDSLKYLEAQGVKANDALQLLVESSRRSGRTFEESAADVEQVAAQADVLRERLSKTDNVLQGFSLTVRDDMVRAIADATRNLDSQVISIDNVAASYAFATEQAAKYGQSTQGATKIAGAFNRMMTEEREDAFALFSGRRLRHDIEEAMQPFMKDGRLDYEGADEQTRRQMEEAAASSLEMEATDENRGVLAEALRRISEGDVNGLSDVDFRNLFAGSTRAIESDLNAAMEDVNLRGIKDTSVLNRLLKQSYGLDLNTSQLSTFSRMLKDNQGSEVAEQIQELMQEAQDKAVEGKDLTSSALTAVLSFKDPIQQLFNIKDFLKSIMLNVSNLVKLVSPLATRFGLDIGPTYTDYTAKALEKDFMGEEAATAALASLQETQSQRTEELAAAVASLSGATTESEISARQEEVNSIREALEEAALQRAELTSVIDEHQRLTGTGQPTTPTAEEAGFFSQLSSRASEALDSSLGTLLQFSNPEAGRAMGLALGNSIPARPDPRTVYETSSSRPVTAAPGEMEADGVGEVTVNGSGESVMTVRMKIRNMGEVIAHHNTAEARQLDHLGLGG